MKYKNLGIKIGISIVSLLLCLTLLEVSMRILGAVYMWGRDEDYNVVIFRRNNVSLDKPADVLFGRPTREGWDKAILAKTQASKHATTILCVGDSYTFGGGVSYTEAYPYVLEQMLNDNNNDTLFNVVNGGVCEYNTRQTLKRLPSLITRYNPQMVVLMVGAGNRINLALYDVDKNPVKGWLRSLRIYKMARLINLNIKDKIWQWKLQRSVDITHNATNADVWRSGFPLKQIVTVAAEPGIDGFLSPPIVSRRLDHAMHYVAKMKDIQSLTDEMYPHEQIWYFINQKKWNEAISLGEKYRQNNASPEISNALAYAYVLIGQHDKARAVYDEMYKRAPDSEFVKSQLALYYHNLCRDRQHLTVDNCLQYVRFQPLFFERAYHFLMHAYQRQSVYSAQDILRALDEIKQDNKDVINDVHFNKYYDYFKNQEIWESKIVNWMKEDLDTIIKLCRNNNITVVVQNYPHQFAYVNDILQQKSVEYNLIFVDNYSCFKELLQSHNESDFFLDDLHPASEGHRIIARNVYEAITNM